MGKSIFFALALVPIFAVSGCASSSVQVIGKSAYMPLPMTTPVAVYTDDSQIKSPYEVIGIISYIDPGKYQILNLGDAIEPLKKKAREIGGNGIIIGQSQAVKSGFISTGISVDARAIRVNE